MEFETAVAEGVLRFRRPATRWLSTGWAGGFADAPAAYNVTVPEGWERTDLDAYIDERRHEAGFGADAVAGDDGGSAAVSAGPALLTGVAMRHARVARAGFETPRCR